MAYQPADEGLWMLLLGRPSAPIPPRALKAGPIEAGLSGTDVIDVRSSGRLLASRIGVRVRDPDWGTVESIVTQAHARDLNGGFEVQAACRSNDGRIDLEWSAAITGAPDGSIIYELSARARREFEYARIGICVLLPADTYAGRPFRSAGGDDPACATRGELPALVAPPLRRGEVEVPLFPGFRRLDLILADATVEICFEGDVLELEDQRNWTDGTFKIYSSSVSDPLPRRMRAGELVSQQLRLALAGSVNTRGPRRSGRTRATAVMISVGGPSGNRVPALGAALDRDDGPAADPAIGQLRDVGLAHLRIELHPNDDARAKLARGMGVADQLGAEVELVLFIEPGATRWPDGLEEPPGRARVARVIAVPPIPGVSTAADIVAVRAGLPGWLEHCPIVGGTDSNFAELNAERPDGDSFDGLVFSANPQVHDTDEQALVESLTGQRAAATTALSFARGRPICVSPVTLKPRPGVDHRQRTSFLAAWMVGSVASLSRDSVTSVTYFELTGPQGLISRTGCDQPGARYPVLEVIELICASRGALLLTADVSDTSLVTALAIGSEESPIVLIANLSPGEVDVELRAPDVTGPAVTQRVAPFRNRVCEPSRTRGRGTFELSLAPFSVRLLSAQAPIRR